MKRLIASLQHFELQRFLGFEVANRPLLDRRASAGRDGRPSMPTSPNQGQGPVEDLAASLLALGFSPCSWIDNSTIVVL